MAIIDTTISQLRTALGLNATDQYYTKDIEQEGFWYADGYGSVTDDNLGTVLWNSTNGQLFKRVYDAGFVNAKWFGAKGDGTTDDTTAIQASLDCISDHTDLTLTVGGGTVFLPKGDYMITDTLLVGQNCRLIGVSNRYHGFYLNASSSAGTVIRANFDDNNKWVISSATYNQYNGSFILLPYDIALSKGGRPNTPPDYNSYTYDNYIYRMGINIENLTIDGGQNVAFGGIRLSNAGNSTIRNVGVFNTRCGIMLNTCWGGSIENSFTNSEWYGVLTISCNSLLIIDSYIRGRNQKHEGYHYEPLIGAEELPKFIYQDSQYSDWGLDDDVKFGKTSIYCSDTMSLAINATVAEQSANGIACLCSSVMSLTSIYIEEMVNYGITIGVSIKHPITNELIENQVIADQVNFYWMKAAFYLGSYVMAQLHTIFYDGPSFANNQLFVYNSDCVDRNILFSNTVYVKRKYYSDILFIDEGVHGQNYGAVYIDPTSGNDDNYGFNKNDALQTFDSALVRIQNQSTINPIKTIYIKAALPVSENVTAQTDAAIKNLNILALENCNILITSYDFSETHPKARIYFEGREDEIAEIGRIDLLSNVNLYFKNVDLVCNTATAMSAEPTNLSMFGLTNSYAKVTFESNDEMYPVVPSVTGNIFLDLSYFIFQANIKVAMANTPQSLLDVKFLNINIVGGAGLSSNLTGTSSLGVDCVQINSIVPSAYYSLPNTGWQDAVIMRNNF